MASSIEKRQNYWLGVVRGLQNMKEGLQGYVDSKSKSQYKMLMEKVDAMCDGQTCTVSGNICDELRKEIKNNHVDHKLFLQNTDCTKWQNPDVGYWEVAKCYLRAPGYYSKTEPYQVDVRGLLTICINSTFFRENIENIQHFKKVREIINVLAHTDVCQLDKQKADQYLDMMIAVLQDNEDLISDDFAKHAAFQIQKIKDDDYGIQAFWQETKHELQNACPVKDTPCEIQKQIQFESNVS